MNQCEALFRAIGDVGDDLIARAEQPARQKSRVVWLRWSALAACCMLVVGLAAIAHLDLSGEKSADSTASYAADTAEPESYAFENESAKCIEAPAPESADAEEAPEEVESCSPTQDASAEEGLIDEAPVCSISFGGVRYCAASAIGAVLQPGEALGVVEESDDSELLGCAVYARAGVEPEEEVLLLLDGEYLLFRRDSASASGE